MRRAEFAQTCRFRLEEQNWELGTGLFGLLLFNPVIASEPNHELALV